MKGKVLIIKGADFSAVAIDVISPDQEPTPTSKTYDRTELDSLVGENGKFLVSKIDSTINNAPIGSVYPLSPYNYRLIPISGFSKIILSGFFPTHIGCFYNSSTPSSDTVISGVEQRSDITLSDFEITIPSGASCFGINLTDSPKDQVVELQ